MLGHEIRITLLKKKTQIHEAYFTNNNNNNNNKSMSYNEKKKNKLKKMM